LATRCKEKDKGLDPGLFPLSECDLAQREELYLWNQAITGEKPSIVELRAYSVCGSDSEGMLILHACVRIR
jgi:hypothetical protein